MPEDLRFDVFRFPEFTEFLFTFLYIDWRSNQGTKLHIPSLSEITIL